MAHVRKQIRDAVTAVLLDLGLTGYRVYSGRVRPLAKGSDPALFVYSLEEEATVDAMGSTAISARALNLAVEGRVQTGGDDQDPEDTLDGIASEVEAALFASYANAASDLHTLLVSMDYTGMRIELQGSGESLIGAITMQFRCAYRVTEGDPTAAV